MPTYEYQCQTCGHRFEVFQSINDVLLEKCPRCNKPIKRLIGPGMGFILKGSGIYPSENKNLSSEKTCCGRSERCNNPPCLDNGTCNR